MKTYLAALALAAALAQSASATTFPTLTTIYVAANLFDGGGAPNTGVATVIACSNVSGQTAQVRYLALGPTGAVAGQLTLSLTHGQTATVSTHQTLLFVATSLNTGQVEPGGALNIESTQSGVFCHASIIDAAATVPNGIDLHLVRVNPHPGTVE